jgi:hypothetical protein
MATIDPAPDPASTPSPLREVHYPLKQLLREVEYDRHHSNLGTEILDQMEIGSIFAGRNRLAKAKKG